jgi:hypothetical protein
MPAVRFVVVACASALGTLMAVGLPAVEARPFYYHQPPVTVGEPWIAPLLAVALAVAVALELAIVVYFTVRRKRRAQSAPVERLRPGREHGPWRKAA